MNVSVLRVVLSIIFVAINYFIDFEFKSKQVQVLHTVTFLIWHFSILFGFFDNIVLNIYEGYLDGKYPNRIDKLIYSYSFKKLIVSQLNLYLLTRSSELLIILYLMNLISIKPIFAILFFTISICRWVYVGAKIAVKTLMSDTEEMADLRDY